MEPTFQWEYSGVVVIPRADGTDVGSIELPFVVISSGDEAQLTNAQIESAARSIANQFLSMIQGYDPTRRQEFAEPTQIFLTSITDVAI